jgi:N-acyl homoserine lactone hydrolase
MTAMNERTLATLLLRLSFLFCVAALLAITALGCAASHHPTAVSELGTPASSDAMFEVVDQPGPIAMEKVLAANWMVVRSGLINLDHPAAKKANLEDGDEEIEIYFYVLRHPEFGTYIVDSGVETGFRSPDSSPRLSWVIKTAMKTDSIDVQITTGEWLSEQSAPLDGVFLTHLHLDHIMGLPDISGDTLVYSGPGETDASDFLNGFSRGTTDRLLEGVGPLQEWRFEPDPAGRFAGVLDVFGDGSLWALHVPGHTPGSTAFLVRTPNGPELLLGDATHTRWGWENGVEPGSFSLDQERSAESLKTLLDLSERFPQMPVHPGHQSL